MKLVVPAALPMTSRLTAPRAAALAALAAAAVYAGSLGHGFVWDDHIHIEAAPFVQDARNLRVLASPGFWLGRVEVEGSARPLLLASLLADRALWGTAPRGYHLTNILLHAAAAAALTLLAAAVTAESSAALLAGLLFALHPVQSEAVCAVSFRADIIAALFVFLALLAARRAHDARPAAWTATAAAAFALALLAKESAAVFPALYWLTERLTAPPRARAKLSGIQLCAFLVVLAAYAAFRAPRGGYASLVDPSAAGAPVKGAPAAPTRPSFQIDPSPPPWKAALPTRGARARAMLSVFLDYARLIVWPAGLQADRSPVLDPTRLSARALGGAAVALAMLAAGWWARRRLPAASLGMAWFFVALAPVAGIVPLHNLIAERYLYLPLAGLCLAAAAALQAASRRAPRPAWALACAGAVLAGTAAAATARRVPAWRDDAALFGGRIESDGSRLRYNRGLLARGTGDYSLARAEYRKALELDPGSVEAMVNLSEVEGALGHPDEELALLRRATAANPRSSTAQEALGNALQRRGRRDEALDAFKRAVGDNSRSPSARARYARALFDTALEQGEVAAALDPKNEQIYYENGRIAQDAGRYALAAESFRRAVRADPKHALAWANLGACLHREGKLEEALGAMQTAIKLLPGSADSRRNLGALLDDLGREDEAEKSYAEAVRLDPGSALGWHGYGVVLQKSGRAAEAARAYQRAIEIEPDKFESLMNLSALRLQLGEPDKAETCLLKALAARPGDPVVLQAIESFERATGRQIAK
jgi:tetratricopeptide (TPR) repeat protein